MEKKATRFESFLDGLVNIYQLDQNRKPVLLEHDIRFQNRVVGAKRNFEGEQAGYKIEKLIRIPKTDLNVRGCFAVIRGQQYKIIQAQEILDTIPKCMALTLAQPDLLLTFDEQEVGAGGRV